MNNRLEIKSYVGVGPIVFGMTAEEVRSTLGCTYIEIAKGLSSTPNADAFDSLGVFVYYNLKKKCKAIEMAGPLSQFTLVTTCSMTPLTMVLNFYAVLIQRPF